jgi:ferrous iron transport protein A
MEIPLTSMKDGAEATVISLAGGLHFQMKLRTLGIREGKVLKVVAIHPFSGPFVVEVDRREITLGFGIAQRIMVEVK